MLSQPGSRRRIHTQAGSNAPQAEGDQRDVRDAGKSLRPILVRDSARLTARPQSTLPPLSDAPIT